MSFITEALTAFHAVALADPVLGTLVMIGLITMSGTLSGGLAYMMGKTAGQADAERRSLATTDGLLDAIFSIEDKQQMKEVALAVYIHGIVLDWSDESRIV